MPKDNSIPKENISSANEKSEIKLYKLGVEDKIRVDIKFIQGLILSVLPDGTINLPRIGSLYISCP